jgi:hypothetical protein
VTSNTALACAGVCLILFGLTGPCDERRTADPRKTLADGGFTAVEFHGHDPNACWWRSGAHRFTATIGGDRVSGVVCCFDHRPGGDPCTVRYGLGAEAK